MAEEQGVAVDVNDILDEMAAEIGTLKKELAIQRATNKTLQAQLAAIQQTKAAESVELSDGPKAAHEPKPVISSEPPPPGPRVGVKPARNKRAAQKRAQRVKP